MRTVVRDSRVKKPQGKKKKAVKPPASIANDEAFQETIRLIERTYTKAELEARLMEGLRSPAKRLTSRFWKERLRRLVERHPELSNGGELD